MGVLVICVLVFAVFCIVCTVVLYCFLYVYFFLDVASVRTTATVSGQSVEPTSLLRRSEGGVLAIQCNLRRLPLMVFTNN